MCIVWTVSALSLIVADQLFTHKLKLKKTTTFATLPVSKIQQRREAKTLCASVKNKIKVRTGKRGRISYEVSRETTGESER